MTDKEIIEQATKAIEALLPLAKCDNRDDCNAITFAGKTVELLEQATSPEPEGQDDGGEFTKRARKQIRIDEAGQHIPPHIFAYYHEACDRLDAQQKEIEERQEAYECGLEEISRLAAENAKLTDTLTNLSVFPAWLTYEAGLDVKLCIINHNKVIDKIRSIAKQALLHPKEPNQ